VRVTWRELYVLQSTILLHTNNRKLIAIPFREREGVIQVGEGGGRVWHGKRKKRSRVELYRERGRGTTVALGKREEKEEWKNV
jgi:hypothetical protein